MKRFVVLVALLVSSGYASAGRTLTLEECRELAIQNNKELKISGEKIAVLKHAINLNNAMAKVPVGDEEMSIDTILVKMAQLNKRKNILDMMRKQLPKERLDNS